MDHITMQRAIPVAGMYNMRDLGGLPCQDGGTTRFGVFVRSDSPHALTVTQQHQLIERGITTVLDLRSSHECALHPNPFATQHAVHYTHVPLRATGLHAYDLRQITSIDRYYTTLLRTAQHQFVDIFTTLLQAQATTLFHCRIGKDRTGMLTALMLDAVGVPHEVIVADYALTTANIVPLIAQYQAERPWYVRQRWYEGLFEANARYMQRFLIDLYRHHGGAAQFLATIGLPDAPAYLRQRLCTPHIS
jgi:protein-tyrosine phosphatase